jgi:leucyl/phenylalanyl-tRNA--protein transferase
MTWFSPDPRAILEPDALHISRSLHKTLRQNRVSVRFNQRFPEVIAECSAPGAGRMNTWISREIKASYIALHRIGHAHSVEVYQDELLVGGLYGVTVGGLFAGESMFSKVSNASKVALVHLIARLKERGYGLLDVQQDTPHLRTMGATSIRRSEYMRRLEGALKLDCCFD